MPDYRAETAKERYTKLLSALKTERQPYESHYRDLGDYFLPTRPRFSISDRKRVQNRQNKTIIDSTGTFAARTLQSGLHSGMTSPARPWYSLTTPDPELAEFGPVKDWLHVTRQRLLTAMLRSNIYQVLPTLYGDAGVFATGSMSLMEDDEEGFRCYDLPIGTYYLANDAKRRVRVFAQETALTVRQLVEMFGTKPGSRAIDWSHLSSVVKNHWDRSQYDEWVNVVQVIEPNIDYDANRLGSQFKPYKSCYFETDAKDSLVLQESGYDEFPVFAFRWEVSGNDTYGTNSPGMMALGDVRQLQLGEKYGLQAIEKKVKPPMVGPPEMRTSKASILPGDMNYLAESQHRTFRPVFEVKPELEDLEFKQAQVRDRINQAFFVDVMLMIAYTDRTQRGSRQPPTAREIDERHEEKFLMLAPVLERGNQDLLGPIIDRVFAIENRRGNIPPSPPELEGQELRVEYLSIMAQAQKRLGLGSLQDFVITAGNIASFNPNDPGILDKWDIDQTFDELAESLGVPPRIIVPDEVVAERRAARAQAAQAQQAAEQAATLAPAAKQLSETDLSQDSALTALLGSGAAGPTRGLLPAGAGV